jgi:hypothetical protein
LSSPTTIHRSTRASGSGSPDAGARLEDELPSKGVALRSLHPDVHLDERCPHGCRYGRQQIRSPERDQLGTSRLLAELDPSFYVRQAADAQARLGACDPEVSNRTEEGTQNGGRIARAGWATLANLWRVLAVEIRGSSTEHHVVGSAVRAISAVERRVVRLRAMGVRDGDAFVREVPAVVGLLRLRFSRTGRAA